MSIAVWASNYPLIKESDGTYRAGEVVDLERADVNQSHTGLGCQSAAGRKRVEHIKQM